MRVLFLGASWGIVAQSIIVMPDMETLHSTILLYASRDLIIRSLRFQGPNYNVRGSIGSDT